MWTSFIKIQANEVYNLLTYPVDFIQKSFKFFIRSLLEIFNKIIA